MTDPDDEFDRQRIEKLQAESREKFISLRAFLRFGWIRLDSSLAHIQSYLPGVSLREVQKFWPYLVRIKECPECGSPKTIRIGAQGDVVWYSCPKPNCQVVSQAKEDMPRGQDFTNPEVFTDAEWEEHQKLVACPWAVKLAESLAKIARVPF